MLRNTEIEKLIEADKLTEAMEILKLPFKSGHFNDTTLELLDRAVSRAIDKGDVAFAANAAIYRVGWFRHIEISEKASWNRIIHEANKKGGFPKIDIPTEFLEPRSYGPAPFQLTHLSNEIWKHFKDHNWEIPGYEVIFGAYGQGGEHAILALKVEEIRGKDFIIGFSGRQGEINSDLSNTAGFNFVATPNFLIEFYEDNSGPVIYKYSGNKWEETLSKMDGSWFSASHSPDWTEVDCRIPKYNQVFIEDIFADSLKATNAAHRASGEQTKEKFVEEAVTFLQKNVMTKLKAPSDEFKATPPALSPSAKHSM